MSRDENRARMPGVAAIVDQFRPLMGSVIYASENGHVIDRREPETNVFDIPPGYRKPMQQKERR